MPAVRFEEKLWAAADKLRGSMDAAEYKHVVLGLVFLKYISDSFDDERAGGFRVPAEARWEVLRSKAAGKDIGATIDSVMALVERANPSLDGTLPKDYGRESLDPRRLGELVNLVSSIELYAHAGGGADLLGQVYEYFLGRFASAEGKGGGEFYTPGCVVRLLVEMIEPFRGRVYDPCCGSGGMFVQATKFVEAHAGNRNDIRVFGQELNYATWRLAKMNLAIRHISADLGRYARDTFHSDLHPDLKADFVLANPPFNVSDWGGETLRADHRWQYGVPPAGNANFAWLQHIAAKLAPRGVAGVVLANGSMSSRSGGEGHIRRAMVEHDLVECMVALPPQLFTNTGIPACLWFLNRDKTPGGARAWRDRRGEVLFVDARGLGTMVTRVRRELSDEEIKRIADTYHAWRGEPGLPEYADVPGFCYSATLDEIAQHGHVLTPGRYVGAEAGEADGEPVADKIARLRKELEEAFAESDRLQHAIRTSLAALDE